MRVGYICLSKTPAENALVHLDALGEESDEVFEDPTRIRKILWEYHTADALLQGDEPFSNRRRRLAILAGMIGIEFVESGGVDRTWDEQLSVMDLLDGLMSDGR